MYLKFKVKSASYSELEMPFRTTDISTTYTRSYLAQFLELARLKIVQMEIKYTNFSNSAARITPAHQIL